MTFEMFFFLMYLSWLWWAALSDTQPVKGIAPNVVAVLLLIVNQQVGMFWAWSCFPSGFWHFFMVSAVFSVNALLFVNILAPLSRDMCREVIGRVAAVLLVPVLCLAVWTVPTAIADIRHLNRLEAQMRSQHQQMQLDYAALERQGRDLQFTIAEAQSAMDAIVKDAVRGRYSE